MEPLAHRRTDFSFTLRAPRAKVAPLFGAERERAWAPGWNPRFLFPTPARDAQGAVFAVDERSVWINTAFDLERGHIQYVSFIPDEVVTLIDIHVSGAAGASAVAVAYERTALQASANERVARLAHDDAAKGPHWAQALQACLDHESA